MKTLTISDPHLNPKRQGGTTMESREALEDWQFEKLEEVLDIPHDQLIIVGDLFDKRSVSEKTLLRTYNILAHESVILLRGNHDSNSMKYGEICSLELLHGLLPASTLIFDKPRTLGKKHFIPHCFDQEEFDGYIEQVPEKSIVFIHANNDNHFAVEADHSLNLSKKQREDLIERGCHIILGHEHGFEFNENMAIPGCLMPTSISDCTKGNCRALMLTTEEGAFAISTITTWEEEGNYLECDYSDIEVTDHQFVRINGECAISEYPEIVRNIAKLRKESDAFIIANNVKVRISDTETLTAEEVTNFNIIELLLERIDKEFREEVESCI